MLSKEHRAIMLGSQTSKLQDSDGRENKVIENFCNLESEHDMITGWTASDKKYFLMKNQFGSPKVLYKSATQRNRHLLRCKINRSLNFDLNFSRKHHLRRLSPNSSLDNSCFSMNKPSRDLSRSAKIMRALSDVSFRHRNENIKKSLRFESSPEKTNNSDESTSVDSIINTPDKSLERDRNLTDASTTSSAPTISLESIDENQNQTPQQSRKISKILSDTSDTKRSSDKSGSSGSTSLLRSNMKERIDSITRNTQTPDFQYLKQDRRLRPSCDIIASTPRNLLKEFNNGEEDSPHTPENIMQFIPEGMSSIKKSHKKERSYCVERAVLIDDPLTYIKSCAKRTTESLETDDIPTSSSSHAVTVEEFPKKSKNVKKVLVYNLDDGSSNNESISDDAMQKTTSKNTDSSDNEMCKGNAQDIHDILPSTSSTSNHNEKENDSYLQEASSSNVDLVESENRAISKKSDPAVSQDKRHLCSFDYTYPILENVKKPYELFLEMKAFEMQDIMNIGRSSNISKSFKMNMFENERPITPENINSSRLLLPKYMSVKKSHKKDKRKNKSLSGFLKYGFMDNECKKSVSLHADYYRLQRENNDEYGNESFARSSSPDESNQKRKRFMSISLQSDKNELTNRFPESSPELSPESSPESLFSKCQNTDNEFKIFTPIRKRMSSILGTVRNYVYRTKAPPEKENETTEAADTTNENGRLTPINMSTAELLCNIDSIKKSHKKDKHDGSICRKRILGKKLSEYTKEAGNMNVTDSTEISEDYINPNDDDSCDETGACSNTCNENKKSKEKSIYDPQPSTSREDSVMEDRKDVKKLKSLSTTPPNNLNTLRFMKLLHATSIKKSHKKERDLNAQSKYILMNHEYDLSDDGSIFDEEDKSTYVESSCQYNKD